MAYAGVGKIPAHFNCTHPVPTIDATYSASQTHSLKDVISEPLHYPQHYLAVTWCHYRVQDIRYCSWYSERCCSKCLERFWFSVFSICLELFWRTSVITVLTCPVTQIASQPMKAVRPMLILLPCKKRTTELVRVQDVAVGGCEKRRKRKIGLTVKWY